MFRRVLANVLGKMVKRGQLPLDIAEKLAKTAAYARPQELFFSSK
jgi:glucuronate isomerase